MRSALHTEAMLRNRLMSAISLASIPDTEARLRATGYLPSAEIATSVFLADRLEKPVLVEGPARRGAGMLAGKTPQFKTAAFPAAPSIRAGDTVRVRVESATAHSLACALA